jgi:hypothetical protein
MDGAAGQEPIEAADRTGQQLAEIGRLERRRQSARLDPAQAEDIGDEAIELVRLVVDQVEQIVAAGAIGVGCAAQVLRDGPDRGQWRTGDRVTPTGAARRAGGRPVRAPQPAAPRSPTARVAP